MSPTNRGPYSAAPSALGYIYQVRYALLESLQRLRKGQSFVVAIETLDDVVFEQDGDAPELLQTKHQVNSAADLTDGATDLWKTLRIWCEGIQNESVPSGTLYFLVTTAKAADGQAAHYLTPGENRSYDKALERLNSTADSSTNQTNAPAYHAYRGLNEGQRKELLRNAFVVDSAPHIADLDAELKEVSFGFVQSKFLDAFLQRLEGWWYRRAIHHLTDENANPILSEELDSETASLREQFKEENLPIDDDIMSASVDASGYQDRVFVHQLRIIEVGNTRIFHAIRNLYRAYEQRSRWMREDLLYVGELDQYENRLVEEWDILFLQMRDELGEQASEDAKKAAAQTLYKWVETGSHRGIRAGVTEPSIPRGTYQLLSDAQRVGWHLDFEERLHRLLEDKAVTA